MCTNNQCEQPNQWHAAPEKNTARPQTLHTAASSCLRLWCCVVLVQRLQLKHGPSSAIGVAQGAAPCLPVYPMLSHHVALHQVIPQPT